MTLPLNFRVSPELKIKLQRAAMKEHRTLSGFIRHVLEEATNRTLEEKDK